MIDARTYSLFIGAVALLVIAPGPDMAYMLARTITQGRRAGLTAAIGINAGAYVHVAAAIFGLSALIAASATAFGIVKWMGAGYLVWIGWQMIAAKSGPLATADGKTGRVSLGKIFWQGFLSDVLNPKVAIFFLAFLPQFIDVKHPGLSVTRQLLILGVTGNMVAITMNTILVLCASLATDTLRKRSDIVTWVNRTAGALFIALGVRLAGERL
jgi:threonine/homoserine/homoserine lactone efflux protein